MSLNCRLNFIDSLFVATDRDIASSEIQMSMEISFGKDLNVIVELLGCELFAQCAMGYSS